MLHADLAAPAMKATRHVHQATDIGDGDDVGAAGLDGVQLADKHRAGDVGHLDGKQAAEAAARLCVGQRALLDAVDMRQQASWLGRKTETAQAVAAGMIRD